MTFLDMWKQGAHVMWTLAAFDRSLKGDRFGYQLSSNAKQDCLTVDLGPFNKISVHLFALLRLLNFCY